MEFRVVTQGTRLIRLKLVRMTERAEHAKPAMNEIYLTILDIIDETFEKEGARSGLPRWAADTVRWEVKKIKLGLDPRILRATGELHESMTTYRHPLQYVRVENAKVVINSKLMRGKVAQKGYAKGGIPARPYVRFTKMDSHAFGREVMRYIMQKDSDLAGLASAE